MPRSTIRDIWKREHLGLTMIIASLVVIMVTLFLLFSNQQNERINHNREQGTSLARLISRIPFEQLVAGSGQSGALSVLQHSSTDSGFAYVAIVNPQGVPLTEVTAPGVLVPGGQLPVSPASWLGERDLQLPGDQGTVTEFYAPLLEQGEIAGYVRLGYLQPGFGLTASQLPLFASFALPIFLLTPLFYFLLRREVRPFREATEKLDRIVGQSGALGQVELTPSDEMQGFIDRFNRFMGVVQHRIGELEANRSELETSTRLLGYKRARIESALQSFPEAIIVLDESGVVSLANSRLENMVGVTLDRIIGHKPSEWCSNTDVVAFLSACMPSGMRGLRTDTFEYVPSTRSGRTIRIEPYPLFSPRDVNEVLGTLVIFRDVTAEKLARSSSGEFVAHLSHELKTPLNVLAMYSETLLGDDMQDEALRIEAANVIHDEVERLAMLISNMLSITKIEMGSLSIERKRVKLRDLLQDAFDSCTRSGKDKNLKFSLDLPMEISPVALDKNLMRVAINNLLTNAIKYSNPGGAVSMSVEETEQTVRVSVRDNGVGISPEDQERIFDKFFRSEDDNVRQRSGHGLGLSLAREIIQLHHGTLNVNSTPGEGSEFIVEFSKEANLLKQAV
ncbi:MAG: PAS domain-containing sensor histidine kinase [Gammaproteobacteria bacterium]|nr:PAS domain-containing sensor histidine kinase [Gammaproteobacteria bacterium]